MRKWTMTYIMQEASYHIAIINLLVMISKTIRVSTFNTLNYLLT